MKENVFESIEPLMFKSKVCPLPVVPWAFAVTCELETVPTKLKIVSLPPVCIACCRLPETLVGDRSRLNCMEFPTC